MSGEGKPGSATERAGMERQAQARKRRRKVLIAAVVAVAMGVAGYFIYDLRQQLDEARVRVMFSDGAVTLGERGEVTAGDEVSEGARVGTGEGGKVDIGLRGFGTVRLDENSEMVIDEAGESGALLKLDEGRIFHRAPKLREGSEFKLVAPTGQIVVRGTDYFVEAGSEGMLVAVRSGEVEVKDSTGKAGVVGGGEMVHVGDALGNVVTAGERERELFGQLDEMELQTAEVMTGTRPEPGKVWRNEMEMEFLPVPGLERTLVSKWETRVKDFEAFVKATGYDAGNLWSAPGFDQTPDHPVCGLNWGDAIAFCDWLTELEREHGLLLPGEGYRLPTEAEWLAAAGGEAEVEKMGAKGDPPLANLRGFKDDGFPNTAPVGSFPAARSGAFDLVGNVGEWSDDRGSGKSVGKGRLRHHGDSTDGLDIGNPTTRNALFGFRPVLALKSERDVELAIEVKERLEQLAEKNGISAKGWRYDVREGKVQLNLRRINSGGAISSVELLSGLPIRELDLQGSAVTDLSPLAGMPLEILYIGYMPVADLEPLRGAPLRRLSLYNSGKVRDVSPLAEAPLEYLDAGRCVDLDLRPLIGGPLKSIRLSESRISNLEPLIQIAGLDISNNRTCLVLHGAMKQVRGGDLPAAIAAVRRFETVFAEFAPFASHLKPAGRLRELLEWAEAGRKGIPPGAQKRGGVHYIVIDELKVHHGETAVIAEVLGARLPIFKSEDENRWFVENVTRQFWLGLERGEDGDWRWSNGDPIEYQPTWSDDPDPKGYVAINGGDEWQQRQGVASALPLVIEWEAGAIPQ